MSGCPEAGKPVVQMPLDPEEEMRGPRHVNWLLRSLDRLDVLPVLNTDQGDLARW